MRLQGSHLIAGEVSRRGRETFHGTDPATGRLLAPDYADATPEEVDRAARAAEEAFASYGNLPGVRRAALLEAVAERLVVAGPALSARAGEETGLPAARLESELRRTVNQLRMFAELVREGSWVDARIDPALPERQPLPRPDLRRMLVPLGPVAVFGASNFPLAFSVAGGDTASALAAGCPVVVKGHPAHPGASEIAGQAVVEAVAATGVHPGVFSLVHGAAREAGQALVVHPAIKAVAFTGSFQGGKALFDAAARRDEPIPVLAEMGSANPVFLLPEALAERGEELARGLAASVTLGAGQFCTNPGLAVLSGEGGSFLAALRSAIAGSSPAVMVHAGIKAAFEAELQAVASLPGVALDALAPSSGLPAETEARPALVLTDAATYRRQRRLAHEIYGPVTVAVRCASGDEMVALARSLPGHLTATVHGSERDLAGADLLLAVLRTKAGRLIVNGFPTGVEVSPAMHHGGPYPATTDSRFTSVGTAAILRFARPVCFQGFPEAALPDELKAANPLGIWRLVDGRLTKEAR